MTPPATVIVCSNRQRTRRVKVDLLRKVAGAVARRLERQLEIAIHLVGDREMTEINLRFLGHEGSTDIITFDHGSGSGRLHGELFICIPEAVRQASGFRTQWTDELARYVIHGLLHLDGHDDLEPSARRVMKRRENALLLWLRRHHHLAGLERRAVGSTRHH